MAAIPIPAWPTTDHSREYVPIVTYSLGGKRGVNLGVRDTLADMGQTIAENFGGAIPHGKSFLADDFRELNCAFGVALVLVAQASACGG